MKTLIGRIFIGQNILKDMGRFFNFLKFSQAVIITDKEVARLHLGKIKKFLPLMSNEILLPSGEEQKDIKVVQFIWKKLLEFRAERKTLVINFGGGVISDLGGFAASTFMRGLDFINIPTTLLSQADASIGGKTGINFLGIKNLIGTFQQPIGVVIDTHTLHTLPKREFLSGFGEIIKHGITGDKKFFSYVTSKLPLEVDSRELVAIITKSLQIKAEIVAKDEKEKGLRKILNFGHTIGHAIESLSLERGRPLLHGEAIAIGMVGESKLAHLMGLLGKEELNLIEKGIVKTQLPTKINNLEVLEILRTISFDKKNIRKKILWSVPKKIGEIVINIDVPKKLIVQALAQIL